MAAGDVTFVEDPAGMRLFKSWDGPAGRDFGRRCDKLEQAVKAAAPRRTGRMAGEIRQVRSELASGLKAEIGVNPDKKRRGYAIVVSKGSRPHRIVARRGRALRFTIGGVTIFRRSVNHPGTQPHTYLTDALREFTQ